MARARNLKPSFFNDAELLECELWVRLLFAGLWTIADREGRLREKPKQIRIELFPADDVNIEEGLAELASHKLIIRYEVDGERFVQVTNFTKHQTPHYKEELSKIPPPDGWTDSGVVATGPSAKVRNQVLERDKGCCTCGATQDLTLDHIIPRSRGGTDDLSNLQILCRRCNSAKNNRQSSAILKEASANDEPIIGSESRVSRADSLIPESLVVSPDSLIPDSGLPEEHDAPAAPVRGYPPDFEAWWKRYPSGHGNKKVSAARWADMTREDRRGAEDGLEKWLQCGRWKRGMVKAADIWLRDRWWEDDPPADSPRASPTNGARPTFTGAYEHYFGSEGHADEHAGNEPDAGDAFSALLAGGTQERTRHGADDDDVGEGPFGHAIEATYRSGA